MSKDILGGSSKQYSISKVRLFDKCPVCKGMNMGATKLVNEAVINGKTQVLTEPMLMRMNATGINPTDPGLLVGSRIEVISVYAEVCVDCGCIFARKIEWKGATIGMTDAMGRK